jgi:UDP-N-acetylmuramoyl-tripeptide--D-alanyl-D-alanine ligase
MIQSTEYSAKDFLAWHKRATNFRKVIKRGFLHKTIAFKLLSYYLYLFIVLLLIISCYILVFQSNIALKFVSLAIFIVTPIMCAYALVLPVQFARVIIVNPRNRRKIKIAREIFRNHDGLKIAIEGSYGKTSMKELLSTVLGFQKKVAASKGNLNVLTSHARFANALTGDEDILIVEFGEGAPGDIRKFSELVSPNLAILTGIAPAHMESYKTIENISKDFFSVQEFINPSDLYVNGDSAIVNQYKTDSNIVYSEKGIMGLKVSDVKIDINGTRFTLKNKNNEIRIRSALIGRHHIGPLSLAVELGYKVGMDAEAIIEAVAKVVPYEHRMQPYSLNGATIIDDTYNGTIEGMQAGLELLHELKARRKIYVTPGLVEQGLEFTEVHQKLAKLIINSRPDVVVLMNNGGTVIVKDYLDANNFQGELIVNDDPLDFYKNLNLFVASGDLVMMQNDLTDNYSSN